MTHQVEGIGLFFTGLAIILAFRNAPLSKSRVFSHWTSKEDEFFPPLPNEVVDLLNISKLCFLATVSGNEPHLSLMNFTYYQPDEVLIFTTRRNTKKFQQIQHCSNVAVLAHDFPHLVHAQNASSSQSTYSKKWSITLNGTAKCLDDHDPISIKYRYVSIHPRAEVITMQIVIVSFNDMSCYFCREIHLARNAEYAQFISAREDADIALVAVLIDRARMCDIRDQVRHWTLGSSK